MLTIYGKNINLDSVKIKGQSYTLGSHKASFGLNHLEINTKRTIRSNNNTKIPYSDIIDIKFISKINKISLKTEKDNIILKSSKFNKKRFLAIKDIINYNLENIEDFSEENILLFKIYALRKILSQKNKPNQAQFILLDGKRLEGIFTFVNLDQNYIGLPKVTPDEVKKLLDIEDDMKVKQLDSEKLDFCVTGIFYVTPGRALEYFNKYLIETYGSFDLMDAAITLDDKKITLYASKAFDQIKLFEKTWKLKPPKHLTSEKKNVIKNIEIELNGDQMSIKSGPEISEYMTKLENWIDETYEEHSDTLDKYIEDENSVSDLSKKLGISEKALETVVKEKKWQKDKERLNKELDNPQTSEEYIQRFKHEYGLGNKRLRRILGELAEMKHSMITQKLIENGAEKEISGLVNQSKRFDISVGGGLSWEKIKKMNGYKFEEVVKELFEELDYNVEMTGKGSDNGIDLIATKNKPFNEKLLIQAKRYSKDNKISSKEIQQYASLKQQEKNVDGVVIVTTSNATVNAKELASKLDVKIINSENLHELLEENF